MNHVPLPSKVVEGRLVEQLRRGRRLNSRDGDDVPLPIRWIRVGRVFVTVAEGKGTSIGTPTDGDLVALMRGRCSR